MATGLAHKTPPSSAHAAQRRASWASWDLHPEPVPEGWCEWPGLFSREAAFKRRHNALGKSLTPRVPLSTTPRGGSPGDRSRALVGTSAKVGQPFCN